MLPDSKRKSNAFLRQRGELASGLSSRTTDSVRFFSMRRTDRWKTGAA